MIRNIYNLQGIPVGQLSLPDDTPESVWEQKIAEYAQPVPKVIPDVTPRQIKQALVLSGVSLEMIDSALATLPEPTKSLALIEWNESNMFVRSRPLVASVGQMLGWTSQQLDDLWLFAGTL